MGVVNIKNSELFLNSFSEIEEFLYRYTDTIRHDSFGNLVNKASRSNSMVRKYKTDLFELKDLRNAIVHERTDGHIIAEPYDSTVSLIQKIEGLLKDPPGVLPAFRGKVLTLFYDNPASEAVRFMKEKSYSQIPILDSSQNYIDLLTTNTIVRWLGSNSEGNLSSLMKTRIDELLKYKENNNECLFLPADRTFVDVLEIFEGYKNSSRKLESIIITKNGESSEPFLGIITNRDLPVIYHRLEDYEG